MTADEYMKIIIGLLGCILLVNFFQLVLYKAPKE